MKQAESTIIYVLISRGRDTLLAQYTPHSGNFPSYAKDILKRINYDKPYGTFLTQKYNFHSYYTRGFIFLAIVQSDYEMRIIIEFLKQVSNDFFTKFNEQVRSKAIMFGLDKQFKTVLKSRMEEFNNKQKIDKIYALKKNVNQLNEISMQNLDKVLQRGQKIQVMVKKTTVMSQTAYNLNDTAKRIKRKMWWQNKKIIVVIIFLVLLIIFIIVLIACGGFTFQRCK